MQTTVLVTGDRGYVGSVLAPMIAQRGYNLGCVDAGYYRHCEFLPEPVCAAHYTGDIRDLSGAWWVDGIDAIIHLAALSNDPLGELSPAVTEEVNGDAAIHLAAAAKRCGVRRFVFASTQSIYGFSPPDVILDEDAPKNPLTAYAASKWRAEQAILALADENFCPVALRPATVFGVSPRLRCDIVFNNLVACAYTTGRIEVRSDGSPWRPVVHVNDVCNAFVAALEADAAVVSGKAYNVSAGNWTVRDLAMVAGWLVADCDVVLTGEHTDSRSYRVSSERITRELGWVPKWTLGDGGKQLLQCFQQVGFTEEMFRGRTCNRLAQLKWLLDNKLVKEDLRCDSRN